jgi:hypothetical protein
MMHPGKGKVCKTIDEVTPILNFVSLKSYTKNEYLDFEEFELHPIKTAFRNRADQLTPYKTTIMTMMATRHNAILSDQIFSSYDQPINHTFYEFSSIKWQFSAPYDPHYKNIVDYYPNGLPLLMLNYEVDAKYVIERRQVMTFLDAVSSTGGIMGVIIGVGAFFN